MWLTVIIVSSYPAVSIPFSSTSDSWTLWCCNCNNTKCLYYPYLCFLFAQCFFFFFQFCPTFFWPQCFFLPNFFFSTLTFFFINIIFFFFPIFPTFFFETCFFFSPQLFFFKYSFFFPMTPDFFYVMKTMLLFFDWIVS